MTMKKFLLIITLLFPLAASGTERVFVSTDRTAYVSGDRVWFSAFCLDGNGYLSDKSGVAYLELVSSDGTAAQVKVALIEGRGSGEFIIPASTPTGNYRLMAYTALQGSDSAVCGSRILSIYNVHSPARVKDGVSTGIMPEAVFPEDSSQGIKLEVPGVIHQGRTFSISVSGNPSDISISVYHDDGLVQVLPPSLDSFLESFPVHEEPVGSAEYEGETIHAMAEGAEEGSIAILSSSGSPDDMYISRVKADGSISFNTGNIYGNREMVCEIIEGSKDVRIRLLENFTHPKADNVPALKLHKDQFAPLVRRKKALTSRVDSVSLIKFQPRREGRLFAGAEWERYHLDDYTRFATVPEVLTEIVLNARIRKYRGTGVLEISIPDGAEVHRPFKDHILAMMDGVVVSDLDLITNFDAMLLSDVYVYRKPIVSGNLLYNGAVNFVTKNNYVTALRFPPQVCVVDFNGVRYPAAYTGGVTEGREDLREILYWHPSLKTEGHSVIQLKAPSYTGTFRVVAEGLDNEGKAVRAVSSFEVR